MTTRWDEETPRLARLAKLDLAPAEARELAVACEAIAREFGDLAAFAAGLPEPEPSAPGELRPDEVTPASAVEVAGILDAAPRVDPRTRAVLVPRGGA